MKISRNLFVEIISLFLLLGIFNSSNIPIIGNTSIIVIFFLSNLIFMFYLVKLHVINIKYKNFIFFYCIFIFIYAMGIFTYPKMNSLKILTMGISLINLYFYSSNLYFDDLKFRIFHIGIPIYIAIFCIMKIGIIPYGDFWRCFLVYPFLMIYFLLIFYKRERKKFYIIEIFFLIYITLEVESRSVLIMIFVSLFIYYIWRFITKNKSIYRMTFFAIVIVLVLFTFFYLYLSTNTNELVFKVNEISQKLFNKNIFSGRQVLWIDAINLIKEKWMFGYGTGVLGGQLIGVDISLHNLYIQLLIQNGVFGLISFIFLLYSIWMLFYHNKNSFIVRLTASFFVASIVHNNFEIILLQNQVAMALFQWFIFSIGTSYAINKNNSNNNFKSK